MAVCYLRGTNIRTPNAGRRVGDECRIEDLKVGDLVLTLSGESKPVKWIGRQLFKKPAGSAWPKSELPVRLSRFALNEQTPHRDLYVSPGHALLLDGVLIPAIYLVNGTSIVQAMPRGVEEIDYFHIELETHEVIFAECAAAESLLVSRDRQTFADLIHDKFDNLVEHQRLYGKDEAPTMTPCAPRVCFNGRRSALKSLFRRAVSSVVDVRDPIQMIYDRIEARGMNSEVTRWANLKLLLGDEISRWEALRRL
jgi:hypothetical protein